MIREFWYKHGEDIMAAILIICVLSVAAFAIVRLEVEDCQIKTAGMQYETRWTSLRGCQVMMQDGTWLPLEDFYIQAIEGK